MVTAVNTLIWVLMVGKWTPEDYRALGLNERQIAAIEDYAAGASAVETIAALAARLEELSQ